MTPVNEIKTCQYWISESGCKYWDSSSQVCGFTNEETNEIPSRYPYCNCIGTDLQCTHYDSEGMGSEYRCALPDPSRHVGDYKTSKKYAFYISNPDGSVTLDTSLITGYEAPGTSCNGGDASGGTNKTCSGYSPYYMGFGKISPTNKTIEEEPKFSFRLPLNYEVLNLRSLMSTCYWWNESSFYFKLDDIDPQSVPNKSITNPLIPESGAYPKVTENTSTGCTRDGTLDYTESSHDNYPCNGSNTNCSFYTGVCWEYAINDKIETGDKVLAEQILELRYYLKEKDWTQVSYDAFGFQNTTIDAYRELLDIVVGVSAKYEVISTSLDLNQDSFQLVRRVNILVEGTEVNDDLPSSASNETNSSNFPTKVRSIDNLLLSPIVINNFTLENNDNVFETAKTYGCNVLLVGTQHTYVYDTICLHLSRLGTPPSFLTLIDLYEEINNLYVHTSTVKSDPKNLVSLSVFDQFQVDLEKEIQDLYISDANAVYTNSIESQTKSFMFDIDSDYGDNDVIVLSKYKNPTNGSYYWGFSKFSFVTSLISGFLLQTDYSVKLDPSSSNGGTVVDRLYDYRKGFLGFDRVAKFEFLSYTDKSTNYRTEPCRVYNDFLCSDLLESITYTGNTVYNYVNIFTEIVTEELFPIGPSGYILVNVQDEEVMTEVYGKIEITNNSDSDLYLRYVTEDLEQQCPVTVFKQGISDGLQSNQFIVVPKDMLQFRTLCKNTTTLYIKEIKVPIRTSFGQEPPKKENWDYISEENTGNIQVVNSGKMESIGQSYIVTDYNSSLTMAVTIKGTTGREIGLVKIKLATLVKLPMVPDVEISYSWSAEYDMYKNLPTCVCCGFYTRVLEKDMGGTGTYTPQCGDHENTGGYSGVMWYPYVQCSDYSLYFSLSNQIFGAVTEVRGLYKETDEDGNLINGAWNMRMEGPQENGYMTGLYCCSICYCSCQVQTYNSNRKSDSYFSGWARYRGEVDESTLQHWLTTGGRAVRFGNTLRPQLKSYRSTDYVQYLYWDYTASPPKMRTSWMWVPVNMSFSDMDYTETNDVLYQEFCNTEVLPINALGSMLFNSVDGEAVSEVVTEERYTFDDVFEIYVSTAIIAYPAAKNGHRPVPQFKSFDGTPIQWAWREPFKEIERNSEQTDSTEEQGNTYLGFVKLDNSPYKFDHNNIEKITTCNEGANYITFKHPSLEADTGVYPPLEYPTLQLNTGLERCFTFDGNLDPAGCQVDSEAGYSELTLYPWLWQGLFDDGHFTTEEEAEEAGQVITYKDPDGIIFKTYYNRGLHTSIITENINSHHIPVYFELLNKKDVLCSHTSLIDFDFSSLSDLTLSFSFAGIKKAISKLGIEFKYGIEIGEDKFNPGNKEYLIFCVPGISIEVGGELVYSRPLEVPDFMGTMLKDIEIEYIIAKEYLLNRSDIFDIKLNLELPKDSRGNGLVPNLDYDTTDSDGKAYEIPYSFMMTVGNDGDVLDSVYLSDTIIKETSVEQIQTHERKYRVSTGNSHEPPHGINTGTQVLRSRFDNRELDTVWQRDDGGSVKGLPNSDGDQKYIHKTRSRFVSASFKDKQKIEASLIDAESEQARLYNSVISKDVETCSFRSTTFPDTSYFFQKHNLGNIQASKDGILRNSILLQLGSVVHYPKMQAKGYMLLPSPPFSEEQPCRWAEGSEPCTGDDVFVYQRVNLDDGTVYGEAYEGTDIYYHGLNLLIVRTKIANYLVNRKFPRVYGGTSSAGKSIAEGTARNFQIPEFFNIGGLYTDLEEWYSPPREERHFWDGPLPGLWPAIGVFGRRGL